MADRTSAEIFGLLFEKLAKRPQKEVRTLARWAWKLAGAYDFDDCQMDCDKALIKLGLAKPSKDEYGDDAIEYAAH